MQSSSIQSLDTSAELPVEQLYNQAVNDFIKLHGQMAKLPADKNDPLPALDAMLRDMGVERDNDTSMLTLGAIGKVGSDAVANAFGIAANNPAMIGSDIVTSMITSEESDSKTTHKPTFRRDTNKTATFDRTKRAPVAPKRTGQKFATSLLMGTSMMRQNKQQKASQNQRLVLKAQMQKRREEIQLLSAFKSCGYKYARRVTKKDKDGTLKSMLLPVESAPKVALTPNSRQRVDMDRTFKAQPTWQAPSLAA